MELEFEKTERGTYVATAEVSGAFNLHVEKNFMGYISVNQKTTGEQFAPVTQGYNGNVYDVDFDGLVFPKQIQVVVSVVRETAEADITGFITLA